MEVVGINRPEQRVVRVRVEETQQLQQPVPNSTSAGDSWNALVGMWQSAHDRPFPARVAGPGRENAISPRATASHGSPPHDGAGWLKVEAAGAAAAGAAWPAPIETVASKANPAIASDRKIMGVTPFGSSVRRYNKGRGRASPRKVQGFGRF